MSAWDPLPKESAQAYDAFRKYCEMGGKRSLRNLAIQLGKQSRLLGRWSKKYNWVARSAEYDRSMMQDAMDKKKEENRKMLMRQMQIGLMLQDKAVKALKERGDALIKTLPVKYIIQFIDLGIRLEKQARAGALVGDEYLEDTEQKLRIAKMRAELQGDDNAEGTAITFVDDVPDVEVASHADEFK